MLASSPRRALLVVLLLGAVVAASLLTEPASTLATVESLADDPVRFGVVVAGCYLVRPLLAWPTTPLSILVGYGLGIAIGVPVALAGVVVTVVPTFLAARWVADSATSWSALPFGDAFERANRVAARYYETAGPIRGVTASRLAPIPSDVSTCAAAASGVGLGHLLVGTAVGELPWTVAGVVVGASAATVTAGGIGDLGPALGVGCAFAALVLVAGPVYRLARRGSPTPDSTG